MIATSAFSPANLRIASIDLAQLRENRHLKMLCVVLRLFRKSGSPKNSSNHKDTPLGNLLFWKKQIIPLFSQGFPKGGRFFFFRQLEAYSFVKKRSSAQFMSCPQIRFPIPTLSQKIHIQI